MRACNFHKLSRCLFIVLTVLSIFIMRSSYADESYRSGLQAYLDGEYQVAQSHWLLSAKSGNSKSMFNLGLLHEQNKIESAESSKANEWYRLAGNAGYLAADYHLAIKLGKDTPEAIKLMQRAADNGFVLAIEHLTGKPATNVANKSEKKRDVAVSQSEYLTEHWILEKRTKYWTIQMLAFNEEEKVQAFIDLHNLQSKAAYFREVSSSEVLYKLIYGTYKTKVQADFARQNLAKALKAHGPWLRSIESVQKVIKAQ